MTVQRLGDIPGFNIDRVAAAAGDDPDVLRLENLDTDIPPPAAAIEATRAAIGEDEANSWLPFTGRDDLKEAVAAYIERRGGPRYDGRREIVDHLRRGRGDARRALLPHRSGRRGRPHRPDLRGHAQPRPAGRRRAAARAAPRRRRRVAARPRRAARPRSATARASSSSTTRRSRRAGSPATPSGTRSPRSAASAISGCSTGRGFEGVLFDGRPMRHPAALPGMRDRTVTVGAPSFEQRMIAWRVGWVVAPGDLVERRLPRSDLQRARRRADSPRSACAWRSTHRRDDLEAANAEWQRRRDETLRSARRAAGRPACRRLVAPPRRGSARARLRARCRAGCSSRRWRRRRCAAGAAESRTATCASSSATSRWDDWRRSATGSEPRSTRRGHCDYRRKRAA